MGAVQDTVREGGEGRVGRGHRRFSETSQMQTKKKSN